MNIRKHGVQARETIPTFPRCARQNLHFACGSSLIPCSQPPIFDPMKRLLCLTMLTATTLGTLAQEANTPAATASQQEARRSAEEQYKIMAADIEQLTANNQVLQEKIAALKAEIAKVREESARAAAAAANNGVSEDLKRLAEKIQEVDKKREADKQVISEEIKKAIDKLGSKLQEATPAPRPRTPVHKEPTTSTANLPAKGFTHQVESGETLPAIVKAYNVEFKNKGMKTITRQQVKDANPNINFDKLLVGQKIIIPDPSSAN